jgi:transposase InsO family protein
MPWKEQSQMDERLHFVARRLEGERMTDLCREFGISRKTGYKIFNRDKEEGLIALEDRSRRPVRYANQLPVPVERAIIQAKQDKPSWGARKIRELLLRRLAGHVRIPACSTIPAVLDRHGLVKKVRKRRQRALGTALSKGNEPNALWCTDFKGEFKLGNRQYCYPLTVTDHASRFILSCEALESTREPPVIEAFHALFRERGLPEAIRSDNGVPFASPNGLYNLSKLSVWWLRLGISIERPHEGLDMARPADVYTPSLHPYDGLPDIDYPFHDRDVLITACGRICMHRKKINISTVLAGQRVGIKEVADGIWLVSFMQYDLGYIDLEQRSLQTIKNPFGAKV